MEKLKMIQIEDFTKETDIRSFGVYMISHKDTDLRYIGSTYQKYGFKQRWLQHLNGFKRDKGNTVLLNIYNKYGIEGFTFTIIESIKDKKIIRGREAYWIKHHDTYHNGANCSLDTEQSLLGRKTGPLSEEHKEELRRTSPQKKTVYLYDIDGNLIKTFQSSVSCDRYFNLRKGRTSDMINRKGGQRRIDNKYFPMYKYIEKENWSITFGHTEESRRITGEKHKGKILTSETRHLIRLANPKSKKVKLIRIEDKKEIAIFDSLNQCDDYLEMTRGCTSKFLKGKCKSLKRKYIVELIC